MLGGLNLNLRRDEELVGGRLGDNLHALLEKQIMSSDPQQPLHDITRLLQVLMSTNNEQRKAGEEIFQAQLQTNHQQLLALLLSVCGNHHDNLVLRVFAAVLLRRGIERSMATWPPSAIEDFKARALHAWQHEMNPHLSQKLSHVLGQICVQSEWPDLLPQIIGFASAHKQHTHTVINAAKLIEIIAEYSPADVTTHHQLIGELLSQFFAVENKEIRISCAKTVAACVAAFESDNARNAFKSVVPSLLSILHIALSQGDELDATSLMDHFVTVAQLQPLFFKSHFDALSNAMLTVGRAETLEFATRSIALEVLVTLSESAPAMARRATGFVDKLVDLALLLSLNVDDDEAAWQRESYADDDFDEDAKAGEEALERIAAGLGGKSVSECVLMKAQSLLSQQSWMCRRAAVSAICRLAEGATKYFAKYVESVIPVLTNCLQDASVRVQYETIQTIGRFGAIFPDDCDTLVDAFLPALATMLHNTNNCARIRGHAASALINLLNPQNCSQDVLAKFVQPLLEAFLVTLQGAPFAVRSPCLVAVGCVAQVCPENFSVFYDQFMPGIKSLLIEATSPELQELRGKAMECAGLIGEAVGAEKFAADALQIMHIFVHAMNHDKDQDVTFEYILPACARIAKALRGQFVQFIPIVCEPLLAGARKEVDFMMEDAGDDDVEGELIHDEETGIHSTVVSFGAGSKKRVSINTLAVQQRTQAARILFELASSLGALLGVYLSPALDVLLAMATDRHSNDVRTSSAAALHKVFAALTRSPRDDDLQKVFETIANKLLEAMKIEPDALARAAQTESLRDILACVYRAGEQSEDGVRRTGFPVTVTDQLAYDITAGTLLQCADCMVRRSEKALYFERNEGLDEDDREAQEDELREEDEQLTVLVDLFGHLLRLQGERYMPLFDRLVAPAFSSYFHPSQPLSLQILATCLIDDAIEFGGESAHKYLSSVVNVLLANTQREEEESVTLRQCSLYGLAVAARVAPAVLGECLSPLLACFVSTALRPDALDEDTLGLTENAVFGLGNVLAERAYRPALQALAGTFPPLELVQLFLRRLPLRCEEMEAKTSTQNLLDLWERRDEWLWSCDAQGSPALLGDVLRVFAECVVSYSAHAAREREGEGDGEDEDERDVVCAHAKSVERIRVAVSQLQSTHCAVFAGALARLPPHLQQVFQ